MNDESQRGWREAALAAALGSAGLLADVLIIRHHASTWPHFLAVGISLSGLVMLLTRSRSSRFAAVAFVLINAALAIAVSITDFQMSRNVPEWIPFRPHQLGILAVALLAPPALWAGLVSMGLFVGGALAEWMLFGAELRARLPGWQLPIGGIYALFGVTLLIYRLRSRASERARVRAETEAAALEQLARTLLAVRDLANSPLQTLEINVALLRNQAAEPRVVADRMERAVDSLREGQRALGAFEEHLHWDRRHESFDPFAVLQNAGQRRQLRRK